MCVKGMTYTLYGWQGLVLIIPSCRCYDSFASEEEFKTHVEEYGHQLYECDKCQSQFVREENFKIHLKNHDAPGWNKNMFATWGKSAKLRNDKGIF